MPHGIRFVRTADGDGPPLVKAANRLTHLDLDRQSPVWSFAPSPPGPEGRTG